MRLHTEKNIEKDSCNEIMRDELIERFIINLQ